VVSDLTYGIRHTLGINSINSFPLVLPPAAAAAQSGFAANFVQTPQPEYTVTRVKGQVNLTMQTSDASLDALTDNVSFRLRIVVHTTEPETGADLTVYATGSNYSLQDYVTADEDFLWQHTVQLRHEANYWADTEGFVGPVAWSIPVDVKSKRRLRRSDGLFLVCQFGDGQEDPNWTPMYAQTDLRTLIQFM